MLHLFLVNLCFSQVLGEANDEVIVSRIVSYKGIMKEAKRGREVDFFMDKTVCLIFVVTQEGFSFLLGKNWKMKSFRFKSLCVQNK